MSGKKNITKEVKDLSIEDKNTAAPAAPFQFNFQFSDSGNAQPAFDPKFSQAGGSSQLAFAMQQLQNTTKDSVTKAFLDKLPASVKARVQTLQTIQEESSALMKKRDKEMRELMMKYEGLQQPLFDQRRKIVLGEESAGASDALVADSVVGVPEFWFRALRNHPELAETITEADEGCLQHLQDVSATTLTDRPGFVLSFQFAPNPYFSNKTLTKTYLLDEDEEEPEDIQGTEIQWAEGKNLTVKIVKKKKGKGSKAKVVKKEEPCDSFFRFFTPPDPSQLPGGDEEDEEDDEEGGMPGMEDLIEADYELALMIRQIVNTGVSWYTGEALLEYMQGMGEYEDEDDDDDDDDDDEESEESEEEKPKPKGKGGHKGKPQGKQTGPNGEECKQQ